MPVLPRPRVANHVGLIGLVITLGVTTPAAAQTGTLVGQVVDVELGESLPGAVIEVEGTPLQTATEATGRFQLAGIPVG